MKASVARREERRARLDFAAIYEQHFAFVWRVLRHLGVPEALLEDATQEVFVVVHRRLADFEGRSAASTWIHGIARRVAREQRELAAHYAGAPAELGPATTQPSPHEQLSQKQAAAEVARFL